MRALLTAVLLAACAIDLRGEDISAVIRRGEAALKNKKPDEAIAAFKECLAQSTRHRVCAYNLASAHSLNRDAPAAVEWLAHAADWGWDDVAKILADENLNAVRAHPDFARVVETIQNRLPPSKPRPYVAPDRHEDGLDLVAMLRGELGSGAAIILGRDKDRVYLATANHVVRQGGAEAKTIEVQVKALAPKWFRARLLPPIADPDLDLAILSVDGVPLDLCALPLDRGGDSTSVRRGDPVYPVGYPGGILWAMPLTPDHASQVFPSQISFESQFVRVGFSGGALLNRRGEIIGMIAADEPPLGRAVPFDLILKAARAARYPVQLSGPSERATRPLHTAAKAGDVAAIARLLANCADPNEADAALRTPLHEAAAQGSGEAVRLLLRAGARRHVWTVIREKDEEPEWGTPLHLAAEQGGSEAVKALIENADVDLETLLRDDDGRLDRADTALHIAAQHDRVDVTEALLTAGASLEIRGKSNHTPLTLAAAQGSVGVARVLLRHGAALVTTQYPTKYSAMHLAAQAGKVEMLKLLVEQGADVNGTDPSLYLQTPLHAAAAGGQVEAATYLISQKAAVDAPGYQGKTPLYSAAEEGTNAVVELLLAHGANANAAGGPSEGNRTALGEAAWRKELAIVQTLVSAGAEIRYVLHDVLEHENAGAARILIAGGADLSLRDAEGAQPLHVAASEDELAETVGLLLKAGAPVNAVDSNGATPLHLAVRDGPPETIELLLAAKASVNTRTKTGRTALYQAVAQNRAPVVASLLKAGADPNLEVDNSADKERPDDSTAVAAAASHANPEILDMLLAAGGDPNRRGRAIASPLSMAAKRKEAEKMVGSLLKAGAKVVTEGETTTPFHAALAHEGDAAARLMALLLGAGGPVDAKDAKGRTPLHEAADLRRVAAMKVLLAGGANVHATDKCGETPLWTAVPGGALQEGGALATAELLVAAGADVNAPSTCQEGTLVELAEKQGYWKVRQLLLSKSAKPGRL